MPFKNSILGYKNEVKPTLLSIVIPAYNEEKRIAKPLIRYAEYFNKRYGSNFEIIVVLNGCRDNTEAVVSKIADEYKGIKYLVIDKAIGKGGAIREGMKIAKGGLVGYTDADGSTPPSMLDRLFLVLEIAPSLDCVVGSRNVPGSSVHGKTLKRKILSQGFNLMVNFLFRLGLSDTQCGAKVIRKETLDKILPYLALSNFAFDINFLVDTRRHGGRIIEFPIEWEDDNDSTISSPLKVSIIMAMSVFRLWLIYSPIAFIYNWMKPIDEYIWQNFLKQEVEPIKPK